MKIVSELIRWAMYQRICIDQWLDTWFSKCFIVVGSITIIAGVVADALSFWRKGFAFVPSHLAVGIVGVTMIIFSRIRQLQHWSQRYFYSLIWAGFLFLLWTCWLYPESGYRFDVMSPSPIALKFLIISHVFVLACSIVCMMVAIYSAKKALHDPLVYVYFVRKHKTALKTVCFSVILLGCSLILLLAGIEILSGLIVPGWPNRELRPMRQDATLLKKWGVELNTWGVRDVERTIKKSSGTTRIVFVGDSFLEGSFCRKTLSGYACDEFDRSGQNNMECVNLGISATGPRHYLYRLRNFGMKLSPDAVLLFIYMGNDLVKIAYDTQPLKLIAERPLPSILGTALPRLTWLLIERLRLSEFGQGNKSIPNEIETLLHISELPYEKGVQRLALHMQQYYFPNRPRPQIEEILRRGGPALWQALAPRDTDREYLMGWRIQLLLAQAFFAQERKKAFPDAQPDYVTVTATASYIEQIFRDLQARHIPLIVFLIPFAQNVDPEYRQFWLPWYQDDEYAPWLRVQEDALFKVLRERGLTVIDLAETLAGIPGTYRKFDGHWTEKGHQIVATQVAQVIDTVFVH